MTDKPDTAPASDRTAVTYIGRRIVADGTFRYVVLHDGEEAYYGKPPLRWATPGDMFAVVLRENDAMALGGEDCPQHVGRFTDAEQVAVWWALDRAAETEHGAAALAKKARAGDNELAATLAPLRRQVKKLPRHRRTAMLAAIIDELTK